MITVIAVGKIKERALTALINEYRKRISSYSKIEIIEVNDEPNDKLEAEKIKELEGQRILKQIKKNSYVVLLDLQGKALNSEELAKKIEQINTYHSSNITFIIGGSLGVSENVKDKADFELKLSELTFPHNLARLLILEQIYRSYKILNNETYHK